MRGLHMRADGGQGCGKGAAGGSVVPPLRVPLWSNACDGGCWLRLLVGACCGRALRRLTLGLHVV